MIFVTVTHHKRFGTILREQRKFYRPKEKLSVISRHLLLLLTQTHLSRCLCSCNLVEDLFNFPEKGRKNAHRQVGCTVRQEVKHFQNLRNNTLYSLRKDAPALSIANFDKIMLAAYIPQILWRTERLPSASWQTCNGH